VARLVLGPLVRYAGEHESSVWVETDAPAEVEVVPGGRARTLTVAGHHYALVHVRGLEPDTATPYEVRLDGETVWPEPGSRFPPSVLRTHARERPVRIAFGSCRVSAPHQPPFTETKDKDPRGRELDALRGLATRMAEHEPETWPHALLMLGDQVYADEVPPAVRRQLAGREVADFEDYTRLYREAWGEPVIRWLLSTVPSAMIFDDHDVHDDWNTSAAWVEEMWRTDWWEPRIVGAFASYAIYQHWGNLAPAELAESELYGALAAAGDATEVLMSFAREAAREVQGKRWSFCRDIGPARLVMIDSRAGRVLEPGRRSMVDADEWAWIVEEARGHADHLLIGTSLPLLLAPALHHLEAWNEAVCDGAWGALCGRLGERLRQDLDLEHWPAFHASFAAMAELLREIAAGPDAPSTITVLSGDVHHAYLAEVGFPRGSAARSAVWQAVCSPFRNPLDHRERQAIRAAWSRPATVVTRALAHAAGVRDPALDWRLVHDEPWFDNQVAWLELERGDARFVLEKALPDGRMEQVFQRALNPVFAPP
jgi:PhoD-like phosphatase